jgi:hypothetical protein
VRIMGWRRWRLDRRPELGLQTALVAIKVPIFRVSSSWGGIA